MQNETETKNYQILSDGRTVWINWKDGMCIGRFSPVGVDIHLDAKGQRKSGRECLDCFPRTANLDTDWRKFTEGMQFHYKVLVPEIHKPISVLKGHPQWL